MPLKSLFLLKGELHRPTEIFQEVGGAFLLFQPAPPPQSVLTHNGVQVKALNPVGLGFSKCKGGGHNPHRSFSSYGAWLSDQAAGGGPG